MMLPLRFGTVFCVALACVSSMPGAGCTSPGQADAGSGSDRGSGAPGQVRVVDSSGRPIEGASLAVVAGPGRTPNVLTGRDEWVKLSVDGRKVEWLLISKDGYEGRLYDGPLEFPGTAVLPAEGSKEDPPGDQDRLIPWETKTGQ